MKTAALASPELMHVTDNEGKTYMGSDQEWYGTAWQRMAGCGPSVAANVLLYMHRQKKITLPFDIQNHGDFVRLMEEIWHFVTPTQHGVNKTSLWVDGVNGFMRNYGFSYQCTTLEIPSVKARRPGIGAAAAFISEALNAGCPIAFLNLSNGKVKNLDNWHWVTIVSMEEDAQGGVFTGVYDAGRAFTVDFKLWLQTTRLGGGLIYII